MVEKRIRKNPAAVALGRRGGQVKSEAKTAAVRLNGAKGGRPKLGLRPADVTVTHEPPDGWWIDLPFGWAMDDGTHGIVADTKRDALRQLDDAQPCDCARCTPSR